MPIVYTTFEPDRALDVTDYEASILRGQGLIVDPPNPVEPAAAPAPVKATKTDPKASE